MNSVRMVGTAVLVCVVSFFAVSQLRAGGSVADETEIRSLFAEYQADWNHHDMQAMSQLFADDAEWINIVGMYWRGKPDIVKAHEVYHRLLFAKTDIHFTDMNVRLIAPNVATMVATEDFGAALFPDGTIKPPAKDRLSFVLVKKSGHWKIELGHNTAILPDAAPYDPIASGWNGGEAKTK